MKTILIANPKGGVGKSTICDEIVYGLQRRGYVVAYINMDNQGGGVHEPAETTDGADFVVIDTPGAMTDQLIELMDNADIVLIPTLASRRDMDRLAQIWEMAKKASQRRRDNGVEPLYGGLVLNRFNPRTLIDQAYLDMCRVNGMHMYGWLPDTTVIKRAEMAGISIAEYDKHSKYAVQMELIIDALVNRAEL